MSDYDELPHIVIERERGGLEPFVWGALIGAAAALLMAPRAGAETQREIRERVRRFRESAEEHVGDARDSVRDVVVRTRDEVTGKLHAFRDVARTRAEQARGAVETGRRAARDARTELERRVEQAKASTRGTGAGTENASEAMPEPQIEVIITEVTVEEVVEGDGLR